jgi:hypothetical protein
MDQEEFDQKIKEYLEKHLSIRIVDIRKDMFLFSIGIALELDGNQISYTYLTKY